MNDVVDVVLGTKNDDDIKRDVINELQWDPSVNESLVGVVVKSGVVTLTGHLDNFAQKFAIERAVARVSGVRAIALELDVKLDPRHRRSDAEIASAAKQALEWNALIAHEPLQVQVESGWLTLRGTVRWNYQRDSAAKSVRNLLGVTGFTNAVILDPMVQPHQVTERIQRALTRQVQREAQRIDIQVSGAVVTLKGQVHSLAERQAAEGATWSAPGVREVINELQVRPIPAL